MNSQEIIKVIKDMIDANVYMIKSLFNKAPFDKTDTGLITKINEDETVSVKIGDKVYDNIPIAVAVNLNDTVKVCTPQNNTNNMFVSAKLGGGR